MFNRVSSETKNNLLLCITGLVVSYVRMFIQYKRYFWDTLGDFFISWFINYLFVGIVFMISGVIIKTTEKYFLPDKIKPNDTTLEEIKFYICMFFLVLCLIIFILGHGPFSTSMYDE